MRTRHAFTPPATGVGICTLVTRVFHSLMAGTGRAQNRFSFVFRTLPGCQCTRKCDTSNPVRGTRDAFEFAGDGSGRGALVVHGFTGSPFEMRWLGERLADRGLHVVGPALAGHARGLPEELDRTTWRDWYGSAEVAFDHLRARCDRVAVVGLSMGGLLALHLARERGAQIAALGVLATPIRLQRKT